MTRSLRRSFSPAFVVPGLLAAAVVVSDGFGLWQGQARADGLNLGAFDLVTYSPTDENFPNPERGFYGGFNPFFLGTERNPLSAAALVRLRDGGMALAHVYYVIDEFRDAPLSSAALDAMTADFAAARTAGVKLIPRFSYSFPCAGALEPCSPANFGITDVPLARVLAHLDQLQPVLQANADVIAFMEIGFVGPWGEWHSSTNNLVEPGNRVNANSAAIVQRVLAALPTRRMTAIRYPYQKQALVGAAPLTTDNAFSGTPQARIGEHNDCFLANESDGGTYSTPYPPFGVVPEAFREFLNADNRFVPQSGETCSSAAEAQPYIGCANALQQLARARWSALNSQYQPEVLELWRQQGCYGDIARRLGYRFRLTAAEVPARVSAGETLAIRIGIANDGFASPYNPRAVEIVLRGADTGREYALRSSVDPRYWGAGETRVVDVGVTVPREMEPGTYQVFLNLPDPEPALHNRPEYSIRLANAGTWEASTGYNSLRASVAVTPAESPRVVLEPASVAGSNVTLRWRPASASFVVVDYALEAGSGSGLRDLFNGSIGTATSLSAAVAPGTYYVRVRARDALGLIATSNEISFVVGTSCTSAPAAPSGVQGLVSNGMAAVSWTRVNGASSYLVQAGPSPGSSSFFDGAVGDTVTVSSPVPPGFRAFVRVFAVNACGRSAASAEILLQ